MRSNWDSENWMRAANEVARSLASFRLGLDADDPFAFNEHEQLEAGHIIGRLDAEGLIVNRMAPIDMQDIRLVAGEGKLAAHDVLAAVNAILKQRKFLVG